MSRRALAKEISEKFPNVKQRQAHDMTKKVFESLKSLLKEKGRVIIHDFGSFTVYKGKKRNGPDTLKVRFRPSAKLLEWKEGTIGSWLWRRVERFEDEIYRKPGKKK